MKPGTLKCLVTVKWLELWFLSLLTALLITSGIDFISYLKTKAIYLSVMTCVTLTASVYNLWYNNLLLNLRFKMHADCFRYFARGFYEWPNFVMCKGVLGKSCRDECCTMRTTVKWLTKTAFIGTFIIRIKIFKQEEEEE